ncbi:uncharacterized protein LOC111591827 [Ceratitis capitata]|uniref:uncharacterized protein LOC111591827 n=1 Tax=Ceratitis capitata TaxID=7213 RepID=UPI000C6C6012|nr:uncharacterized protein LOC111591827 [Ceratitis capitata]
MHKVKNIYNKSFCKNGMAFTEDHIVVRCIRVIHGRVSEYDLEQYFLQFGSVEKFEITYNREAYRYKKLFRSYIRFVEPEAAFRLAHQESTATGASLPPQLFSGSTTECKNHM